MIDVAFEEKFNDAVALKAAGRLADALDLYVELYEQLIKEAEAYARSFELSGIPAGILKTTPHFVKHTEEYLKSDNWASAVLNNVCVILAEAGHTKAASEYFMKAITCMPGDFDPATHKSRIIMR